MTGADYLSNRLLHMIDNSQKSVRSLYEKKKKKKKEKSMGHKSVQERMISFALGQCVYFFEKSNKAEIKLD